MTVAIKEGSKSRQFGNTDYLRTKLVGGGTCDWVREDARQLTKKKVKKDGTYKASDEHDKYGNSYFAFSSFTVAVKKKSITGKRKDPEHPDDPSYDYEVEVTEDENGELVETGLPHHIKITKNPNKLTYTDGDTIEKTGMVVKAYNKDGSLWTRGGYTGGVIPLSEITLEPAKANMKEETASKDGINAIRLLGYKEWFLGTSNPEHIVYGTEKVGTFNTGQGGLVDCALAFEDENIAMYVTKYNNTYYYAIPNKNSQGFYVGYIGSEAGRLEHWANVYMHDAYQFHAESDINFSNVNVPVSENNPLGQSCNGLEENARMIVNAVWQRYGDKKALSDDFKIKVNAKSENGAGGDGGGSW